MRKPGRRKYSFLLIFFAMLLFGGGGCVALPLATVGTLLGSAGAAASAGSEVYNLGKLDFSMMATFDQTRAAATDSAHDLQLHIQDCHFVAKRKDELVIELTDDLNRKMDVKIDRRSETLCQCEVDVGIFGFEPTAKLMMDRIRAHLPDSPRQSVLKE